ACQRSRKVANWRGTGSRRSHILLPLHNNWRNEPVTAARNVADKSITILPIVQRLAPRGDAHAKGPLIPHHARPNASDQLVFRHGLAGVLHQCYQDVERTAAELQRPPPPKYEPLSGA